MVDVAPDVGLTVSVFVNVFEAPRYPPRRQSAWTSDGAASITGTKRMIAWVLNIEALIVSRASRSET